MPGATNHSRGSIRYYRPGPVSRLLACPFCRELFDRTEAELCPECELPLSPLHRLPPSLQESEQEAAAWERTAPEDLPLAWYEPRHGRAALIAVAASSLLSFWFTPWVVFSAPYDAARSGQSLASGPLGWLWGGAVAWAVIVALVLSRRTLRQMYGVRGITMVLAATTLSEVLMLVLISPEGSGGLRFVYTWGWGLYLSAALSALGVCVAWRFGGAAGRAPNATDGDAAPPDAGAGAAGVPADPSALH